MNFRKIT